jgi:transcription factor IIIB subunit 2
MSVRCSGCGTLTVWDDEVGSSVCTSCGALVDPSQCVLTSNHNYSTEGSFWNAPANMTLKSFRAGNKWDLSGQGREVKDRRNLVSFAPVSIISDIKFFFSQVAAVHLVNSLATSFNVPGLSPRAIALFNQARTVMDFRWGRQSTSVVAACLLIALRESNRPGTVRDIASILEIPSNSIIREYQCITAALGLSLTLLDPSVYISTLQGYLSTVLDPYQQSDLPASLGTTLGRINLNSAADTAMSLSHLLARLSPDHDVLRLPVPPTACAIFILALEAELRAPLDPLGELAKRLGTRYQATKCVVMTRYKTLQDEVASWVENIPWLDKYEKKGGRAKVSKRLVVARGLKDVINFQEDVWQQRTKLSNWEVTDEESNANRDGQPLSSFRVGTKEGSKTSRTMAQATDFLLDPLGTPLLPTSSLTFSFPNSHLSTATYILTTPSAIISGRMPSRLQLLASQRGGADEDKISDEELFVEGELEDLLRTEDEICVLRENVGWLEEDTNDCAESGGTKGTSLRKGKRKWTEDYAESEDGMLNGSALRMQKKIRLDMGAFAQFMAEDHDNIGEVIEGEAVLQHLGLEDALHEVNWDLEHSDYEDKEEDLATTISDPRRKRQCLSSSTIPKVSNTVGPLLSDQVAELVFDGWRPPSPESGVVSNDCRYQEEYD